MEQSELIQLLSESAPQFSWFLGAGTSQSAGLPTAVDLMWDLKRRHYSLQENQQISSNDVQNPAVREKIDSYMRANGFPAQGDPGEYSACFDLIFKDDHERQRRYLRAMLSDEKVSLSVGHRVLAALMASKVTKTVFTPNFDAVIEKAIAAVAGTDIAPFHLEGSYAANAALNNDEFPMYTKLHGDFRFEKLKNLSSDLTTQDAELGKCLVNACNRFGLVVVGYSGRDESIMALLASALAGTNPFPHGLFWATLKGRSPVKSVDDLMVAARVRGVRAEVVEIETFDSLMSRLWRQMPDRAPALVNAVGRATAVTVNLAVPAEGTQRPLLRMNGLPVLDLPKKCWDLQFSTEQDWKGLREAERRSKEAIICTKEASIWAWGHEAHVRAAFGPELTEITAVVIGDAINDLDRNLFLKGFLEQGVALGLRRGKPLVHRATRTGSTLIVDRQAQATPSLKAVGQAVGGLLHGQVPGLMTTPTEEHPEPQSVFWAEAVQVDLQEINGRFWVVLKPEVWIWPRWARRDAWDFIDKRTSGRFNKQADALLSAWIALLLPGDRHGSDHEILPFDGVEGPGNPRFVLNDRTAFSRRAAS
jgi:SIR2-like domain